MIIQPGSWRGSGSFRGLAETRTTKINATVLIAEEDSGYLIRADLNGDEIDPVELSGWIVPDDFGTFEISINTSGFAVAGVGKMESSPNLAVLRSEDAGVTVSFTVFELREAFGIRGFMMRDKRSITWEVALRPEHRAVVGGNVVSFSNRRRR